MCACRSRLVLTLVVDPSKARGCSTNTIVIDLITDPLHLHFKQAQPIVEGGVKELKKIFNQCFLENYLLTTLNCHKSYAVRACNLIPTLKARPGCQLRRQCLLLHSVASICPLSSPSAPPRGQTNFNLSLDQSLS